jgi:hydrogenase/urease accessory protein HupE
MLCTGRFNALTLVQLNIAYGKQENDKSRHSARSNFPFIISSLGSLHLNHNVCVGIKLYRTRREAISFCILGFVLFTFMLVATTYLSAKNEEKKKNTELSQFLD